MSCLFLKLREREGNNNNNISRSNNSNNNNNDKNQKNRFFLLSHKLFIAYEANKRKALQVLSTLIVTSSSWLLWHVET